ncbi:MAG: hypothetical protein ACTSW1_00760 [Candidatus Hodarchaeales archaeon]
MRRSRSIFMISIIFVLFGSIILHSVVINPEKNSVAKFKDIKTLSSGIDVEDLPSYQPRTSVQGIFPEPTVEVLSFTDHEMQLGGYGNDTLRFVMEFKPSQTAYYYAHAYLYTNNSFNREQIGNSVYWSESITGGTITVATFDFCAYYLHDREIDGPYAIYLDFYKDNGTTYDIYYNEFVHTTQSYNSSDFLGAPVSVGAISANFIDNDGNGLYEWIDIVLSVNVTVQGQYYFRGHIEDSYYGFADYSIRYLNVDVGTYEVILRFNGWRFAGLPGNSTIKFDYLKIAQNAPPGYEFFEVYDDFYESSTVYATDFDIPPVMLTGKFFDTLLDEDNDNIFEEYWVTVEINKTRIEDGWVDLFASLYVNSSMYYIEDRYGESIFLDSTGLMNVTFKFNGLSIYKSSILNDMFRVDDLYGRYFHNINNYVDHIRFDEHWISPQTYSYSDFIGPGALLSGNTIDYGVDEDADGLYNKLVVEVEINVSKASNYYISGSIEINTTGFNIGYSSNYTYLTPGNHWVKLIYDGSEIFRSGLNDTIKLINLYIYDQDVEAETSRINSKTLGKYIFSLFDPPKARLTGFYSDAVFDDDSDGLYDGLRVYVEVEINESGRYRIAGSLRNPTTGDSNWITSASQYYSTGTHSTILSFDGQWIWRQHTNTTYTLDDVRIEEVDEFDNYIRTWDELWNVYVTNMTDSNDFEHPKSYFTGNINESRIDIDFDGKYEYLKVFVEVFSEEPLNLRLESNLYTGYDSIYSQNRSSVTPGYTWLELVFPSPLLYSLQTNSSYEISFYVYDDDNGMNFDYLYGYITNTYPWIEWAPPGLVFSGIIYDFGVDEDNNGRFDYIKVQIEVNVSQEGLYYLYGYIRADDGGSDYYWDWGYANLVPGTYNITVEIDPFWVQSHTSGIAFYLDFIVVYQDFTDISNSYKISSYGDDIYLANIYYHEDFDLPDAFLVGIVDDYGVDYDTDGLYNSWIVILQINVTVDSLDLYLEADLEEIGTDAFITSTSINLYELTIGVHNVTLEFSGEDLYDSGFSNGAQIRYYRLVRSYDWTTVEESWEKYQLNNTYIWSDFNSQPASYVTIKSVTPATGSLFYINDYVYISVVVEHASSTTINTVTVSIDVDGVYDHHEYLSLYSGSLSEDVWTGYIDIDHGSQWDLTITAYGSDSSDTYDIVTWYVIGAPVFYDFTVNTSSIKVGEAIHFVADVWDASGIDSVTLYAEGSSYEMSFNGNSTYGMAYIVDVTFEEAGEFAVYVNATNIYGLTTKSFVRTIYVNEDSESVPEILSVNVTPSTSIEAGQSITFTVVISKSDAVITSVSLYDNLEDTNYALERISETEMNETWTVTYTPTKEGQHVCTITVLNTRNQVTSYEEIFDVVGGITMNMTPGFEFLVPLIIFAVLSLIKMKRRRLRR